MTTIIAGGFANIVPADAAIAQLKQAGISGENICTFRVNPPGMHAQYPIGGDRDESPGSKDADKGAMRGAAIGAVAGGAAGAILGPVGAAAGAGVGAYTGSLVGGMTETSSEVKPEHEDVRPAEVLVAVNVDAAGVASDNIVRIFEAAGAQQVESAQGSWVDGEWSDFDPVSRPRLIGGSDKYTKNTDQSAHR